MFADDANLFFTHKDIRYLFQIVNQELGKTSTNGLFQKESIRLPLLLPKLIINNYEIQRTESIKFWGLYWMKTGKNTLNTAEIK